MILLGVVVHIFLDEAVSCVVIQDLDGRHDVEYGHSDVLVGPHEVTEQELGVRISLQRQIVDDTEPGDQVLVARVLVVFLDEARDFQAPLRVWNRRSLPDDHVANVDVSARRQFVQQDLSVVLLEPPGRGQHDFARSSIQNELQIFKQMVLDPLRPLAPFREAVV